MESHSSPGLRGLCLVRGAYFLLTGSWPLIHIESFRWVTGPKCDIWLVKTVGVVIITIGGTILSAGSSRRITPEIAGLAVGSAAGLTFIDVYYTAIDRIWDIYLLDALAEMILIGAWFLFWQTRKSTYSAE